MENIEVQTKEKERSDRNFFNFFNSIPELLFILDMEGNILHVNKTVEDRLGYSAQELHNQSVLKVHPKERWEEAHENVTEMLQNTREFCPIPLQAKSGTLIPVETRVCVGEWDGQTVLYGVSKDISALQRSEEKFSKAYNTSPTLLALSNLDDDKFIDVNQTFLDVLGFKKENVIGKTASELGIFVNPEDRVKALVQMRTNSKLKNLEVEVKGKNGVRRVGLFSAATIYVGEKQVLLTTMSDITELKQLEKEIKNYNLALEELVTQKIQKIEYLNLHDDITGLGNQNALNTKFESQSKDNYTLGNKSALYIKLDKHKYITETLGYKNSDIVLLDQLQIMQTAIGRWGEFYRVGTDEFVAIINSNSQEFVVELSKKAQKAVFQLIKIEGKSFTMNARVGVGIGQLEDSLEAVVKKASIALDFVGETEGGVSVYTSEMEAAKKREIQLTEDMNYALENGEFELYFQPIYDVKNNNINHAEALLRWNHPTMGQISPLEFIPIAERTRAIVPITDWIIKDVCEKVAIWNKMGLQAIMFSINLTILSLEKRCDIFPDYVKSQIDQAGIEPKSIIFEVTEGTLRNDMADAIIASNRLREIGVKFAIDDFGAGYSSFAALQEWPLDIAKMDQSLIRNMEDNVRKKSVVKSMISIMHGLDMEVVVEGVESKAQFDDVVKFKADHIQGYLFSKPLPFNDFIHYYTDKEKTKDWF